MAPMASFSRKLSSVLNERRPGIVLFRQFWFLGDEERFPQAGENLSVLPSRWTRALRLPTGMSTRNLSRCIAALTVGMDAAMLFAWLAQQFIRRAQR